MKKYILRRLLLFIPSMLMIYTITFFLMKATPGGPWDKVGRPLPLNVIENLNIKYGLDKPVWQQYFIFLENAILRGDLGDSYSRIGQSVTGIIVDRFPISFQLGVMAITFALIGGLSLGLIGAVKHNTIWDTVTTFFSIIGTSTPNYVAATILITVFAVYLGWLPTGGWEGIFSNRAIIPVVALSLGPMAVIARYTRSSVLESMGQDYIRTARSKGLKNIIVFVRHALRNALIPVTTVAGISFASVITGSFFVESICIVPGIGRYFVTSVSARDYPVIMGTTLLYAILVMTMNLIVDIGYAFLDPRIRYN